MSSPYLPLDPDRKQIRVLLVRPGHLSSPVECDMVVVSLLDDDDDDPDYDALSYAWEGQSPSVPVTINGYALNATKTLALALQRLRKTDTTVKLWADGICINQSDVRERGQQVALMMDVYRKARSVRVWLGNLSQTWYSEAEAFLREQGRPFELIDVVVVESDDDGIHESYGSYEAADGEYRLGVHESSRGKQDLAPLIDLMQVVRRNEGSDGDDDDFMFFQRSDGLFAVAPMWRTALLQLLWVLNRPWWPRLWIIQEIALASSDPIVHVGAGCFSFSELVWTSREFQDQCDLHAGDSHPSSGYFHGSLYNLTSPANSLYLRRLRVLEDELESPEALSATSCLHEATDPRDHYYGMLGLIKNTDQACIEVDYTLTTEQVFVKATKAVITQNRDLSHLYFATQIRRDEGESEHVLPSWCVDWQSRPPNVREDISGRCDKSLGHEIKLLDLSIEISAALIGVVTEVVPIPEFPVTDEKVHDYVRACAGLAARLGMPHEDARFAEALFPDMLSAVDHSGIWEADDALASVTEWCRRVVEAPETVADLPEQGELERVVRTCLEMPAVWADRVFVTSSGLLGHHSAQIDVGDQICGIEGCHHAVVLRPVVDGGPLQDSSTSLPSFEFAGVCHLQDFDVHKLGDTPDAWTRIVLC